MEKANLRKYFHIAHEVTWNLIKKFPEALKNAAPNVGENLRHSLKSASAWVWNGIKRKAPMVLLTLSGLSLSQKMNAQYQAGQQVRLPGGLTGTIVRSSTQQAPRSQRPTITYNQATQQYSQSQRSPSRYGTTQSPLGIAQNTILSKGLIVDAQLTEGLNREIYAYACYNSLNRDVIQLVQRNGVTQSTTRGRCKSDQSGVCNAYCGEQRHIGLEEAQQLAYAEIPVANHTDITRQVFNSAMVESAVMDGAVVPPRQEIERYIQLGYHYDRELSTGIKWDSEILQVMVRGRGHDQQGVIIYKTPKYNEQTGIVSYAQEIGVQDLARLRGEAKGANGNAGNYYQRNSRGYGHGW